MNNNITLDIKNAAELTEKYITFKYVELFSCISLFMLFICAGGMSIYFVCKLIRWALNNNKL